MTGIVCQCCHGIYTEWQCPQKRPWHLSTQPHPGNASFDGHTEIFVKWHMYRYYYKNKNWQKQCRPLWHALTCCSFFSTVWKNVSKLTWSSQSRFPSLLNSIFVLARIKLLTLEFTEPHCYHFCIQKGTVRTHRSYWCNSEQKALCYVRHWWRQHFCHKLFILLQASLYAKVKVFLEVLYLWRVGKFFNLDHACIVSFLLFSCYLLGVLQQKHNMTATT